MIRLIADHILKGVSFTQAAIAAYNVKVSYEDEKRVRARNKGT